MVLHDLFVQRRLAHDAALPHPALADLELRLDQRHEVAPGAARRQRRRQRRAASR